MNLDWDLHIMISSFTDPGDGSICMWCHATRQTESIELCRGLQLSQVHLDHGVGLEAF